MLQIRHLQVTMKKDLRPLLEDLNFTLQPGDKAAIIGEEGNGKSTLLKLLYDPALAQPYAEWSGEIHREGMLLGYLPQELPPEARELTAYEFCCQSPGFLDSSPKEQARAAAQLGFSPDLFYADRQMRTFSGGEKVKLQLGLLTLARPDCCLLDAPAGLGMGFRLATCGADRCVVVTTADASSLRDAQHTVMELSRFPVGALHLVVNRVRKKMLRHMHATIDDAIDRAGLPLLGVVPEDDALPLCMNQGVPIVLADSQNAAAAYRNIANRLQGKRVPLMRIR